MLDFIARLTPYALSPLHEEVALLREENGALREALRKKDECITALTEKLEQSEEERKELSRKLLEQMKEGRQKKFGKKSEKSSVVCEGATPSPECGTEGLVPEAVKPRTEEEKKQKRTRTPRTTRGEDKPILSPHLPRTKEEHPVLCTCCPYCQGALIPFRTEITEKVGAAASHYHVTAHHRRIERCRQCKTLISPPPLEEVFPKSKADETFVADCIIKKFQYGLPLYRQSMMMEQEGVYYSPDALEELVLKASSLVEGVWRKQKERVQASEVLIHDDTPLLIRENGKYRKGALWCTLTPQGEVMCEVSLGRTHAAAANALGTAFHIVAADAYAGTERAAAANGARVAACWTHARRKFVDALISDRALAEEALLFFSALYRIEREVKEKALSLEATGEYRTTHATPIIAALKVWCEKVVTLRKKDEKIAKACTYMLKRWDNFTTYLSDGRVPIDTNDVERIIKRFAVSRKNFMQCSSMEGAKACAVLCSLLFTCRSLGIDPYLYFSDVLRRAAALHHSKHDTLIPHRWKELYEKKARERYYKQKEHTVQHAA